MSQKQVFSPIKSLVNNYHSHKESTINVKSEIIYADYEGSFAPDEDYADYIVAPKGVRLA